MRANLSLLFNPKRDLFNCIRCHSKSKDMLKFNAHPWILTRSMSTKKDKSDVEDDQPIQFSTSEASKWKARYTHSGSSHSLESMPWFQPYSVLASVSIFLIYFCILREENDIDEDLKVTLWDKIPGLEKQQIKLVIDYNKSMGECTIDLEKRLKELQSIENEKK